jgi:hypothetical protein
MRAQDRLNSIEERLAKIEAILDNHVLHGIRRLESSIKSLDARVWAIVILLAGTLLTILLRR